MESFEILMELSGLMEDGVITEDEFKKGCDNPEFAEQLIEQHIYGD